MKDLFRPDARLLVAMLLAWLPLLQFAAAAVSQDDTVRAIHYQIVKHGDAWQLLVDGKPLYLKGAVGWSHFDVLRQCGGNAVRTRATKASLDRAHAHGLKVMAGLPVRGERSGMDWGDSQQVAQQKQKVLAVVEELKDHPALMAWVVGNELDWIPPGVPHHPSLWERLNDLAVAIGRLDPHHPVLTVVGTGRYQQKTRQIAQSCPDMDLLGINAYGDLEQVTELTRKHWPKPYVVAEWGPTGHWQVPKTNWRVPLEQTSTEKAQAIRQRYTRIIQADEKHCLGSFVFLWGQKQETTHTWYGMFRDGRRTESVDVMQHLWSGAWPANRAPAVRNIAIEGFRDRQSVYLSGQGSYRASVDCSDPDDDRLTFQWDIRPEVEIPKNSYAGGLEKPARPIPGLIGDPTTQTVRFTAPADSGPYRLFVEVTDLGGSVGYANLPFYVEDRTAAAESLDASRFEHFVTRDGDRLMEGDKPLRFVGVNMPGLVLPYDYWANRPDRMVLPSAWEQEDGFKTLSRMHMGCVRTWNLPIRKPGWPKEAWQYVWGPGEFNEEAFVTLDRVLALANKYGVRVMIPLTADAGDYLGGVAEYAAHRGKDRKAFFSDPQVTADFKTTIRYVLTRVNTVTGVPYKDDKAVLAWQFGNEMDRTRPGDEIQRRWQAEMAAYVKSIDPNHLVAYGRRFFPEEPDPNIDIVVHHYYGSDWARRLPGDYAKTKGKRPFVISEFGMLTDAKPYRELLDKVVESGTSGIMVWSMYFHHRDGGFWWHAIPTDRSQGKMFSYHWPGFAIGDPIDERPILQALCSASYRIQGLPVAPRVPPEAPQLLPFEKVPMFSWRGAAGAAAYDVQRAARPEGPWSTIAVGISDAEVAYRPLYSDTTARPGQRWCYRVIARNEAGLSPPSNVVGPVPIDEICFVDELKDLKVVQSHSDALELDNSYGSYYCEYLYRIRGQAGQWLLYRVPIAVDRVELVAWNPKSKPALRLSASADGRDYHSVEAIDELRSYTAYNKREITELRVTAFPPRGCQWVRIAFDGAVELDRVELHCSRESLGAVR